MGRTSFRWGTWTQPCLPICPFLCSRLWFDLWGQMLSSARLRGWHAIGSSRWLSCSTPLFPAGLEHLSVAHFPMCFLHCLLFKFRVVLVFQIPHKFCSTYKLPFFLVVWMSMCRSVYVNKNKKNCLSFWGCFAVLKASPVTVGRPCFQCWWESGIQACFFPFLSIFPKPFKKEANLINPVLEMWVSDRQKWRN